MAEQKFTVTSPSFEEGGLIPAPLTCEGANQSPEINWMHPPDGTKSFALIMDDPDAPTGTFTHWILFNIPASVTSLGPGNPGVGVAGKNDFHQDGYGGPCPPPGHGDHRYFFRVYALDVESLDLPQGAPRSDVEKAMEGHVLGQSALMGRFARR